MIISGAGLNKINGGYGIVGYLMGGTPYYVLVENENHLENDMHRHAVFLFYSEKVWYLQIKHFPLKTCKNIYPLASSVRSSDVYGGIIMRGVESLFEYLGYIFLNDVNTSI